MPIKPYKVIYTLYVTLKFEGLITNGYFCLCVFRNLQPHRAQRSEERAQLVKGKCNCARKLAGVNALKLVRFLY